MSRTSLAKWLSPCLQTKRLRFESRYCHLGSSFKSQLEIQLYEEKKSLKNLYVNELFERF